MKTGLATAILGMPQTPTLQAVTSVGAQPSGCWPRGPTPRPPPQKDYGLWTRAGGPAWSCREERAPREGPGGSRAQGATGEHASLCGPGAVHTGTSPTPRLSLPDSLLRTSTPKRTASPQPSGPLLKALPDAPEGPVRTGSQSWAQAPQRDQLHLPRSTPSTHSSWARRPTDGNQWDSHPGARPRARGSSGQTAGSS